MSNDLGFFNVQITADCEVVERPNRRRLNDVEARQIPTGGASVTIGHGIYGIGLRRTSFITPTPLTLIWKRAEVEGIGFVEREDRVEGHRFSVDIETFGID